MPPNSNSSPRSGPTSMSASLIRSMSTRCFSATALSGVDQPKPVAVPVYLLQRADCRLVPLLLHAGRGRGGPLLTSLSTSLSTSPPRRTDR
eukprot:scaffold90972_cov48-Phaeocystis_antarctica.AAC.1